MGGKKDSSGRAGGRAGGRADVGGGDARSGGGSGGSAPPEAQATTTCCMHAAHANWACSSAVPTPSCCCRRLNRHPSAPERMCRVLATAICILWCASGLERHQRRRCRHQHCQVIDCLQDRGTACFPGEARHQNFQLSRRLSHCSVSGDRWGACPSAWGAHRDVDARSCMWHWSLVGSSDAGQHDSHAWLLGCRQCRTPRCVSHGWQLRRLCFVLRVSPHSPPPPRRRHLRRRRRHLRAAVADLKLAANSQPPCLAPRPARPPSSCQRMRR